MLASMTGFSTMTICVPRENAEPLVMNLSLKSLNGRFFEATCRLPYALSHLETELVKRLKKELIRGTVYATVQVTNPSALKAQLTPSYCIVENYLKALGKLQNNFDIPGHVTIQDIMQLPHIFEFPETIVDEAASNAILEAFDVLAHELKEARLAEGTQLQHDIIKRVEHMRELLTHIEKGATLAAQQRKDQLMSTFNTTLENLPTETRDQQLHVLYTQLGRYEVHEELVRFATHLESLRTIVESTTSLEKGKKLDFTTQELFREINTLTSKVNNAEVSSLAIAIKLELEKIREQVQNIV